MVCALFWTHGRAGLCGLSTALYEAERLEAPFCKLSVTKAKRLAFYEKKQISTNLSYHLFRFKAHVGIR